MLSSHHNKKAPEQKVKPTKVIIFDQLYVPVFQPTQMDGQISEIRWDNPDFMTGLRIMFDAKDSEVIVAIELTDGGIRAKFERVDI